MECRKLVIGGCLELHRQPESDYFKVQVNLDGLTAQREIYNPMDIGTETLSEFFARIADKWRGWSDKEQWTSLESDFSITCSHDGVRCVVVDICLREPYKNWIVSLQTTIELGMLDAQAAEAARFCLAN